LWEMGQDRGRRKKNEAGVLKDPSEER